MEDIVRKFRSHGEEDAAQAELQEGSTGQRIER